MCNKTIFSYIYYYRSHILMIGNLSSIRLFKLRFSLLAKVKWPILLKKEKLNNSIHFYSWLPKYNIRYL